MKVQESRLVIGSRLMLRAFGDATVRAIRPDALTRQLVVDVKADSGELLLLTVKYADSAVKDA